MSDRALALARLLAEVLRLQRWAGGDAVSAARVYGLLHGFETTLRLEGARGISEETQDAVEDMLEDVESGRQSTDGISIKHRLHVAGIDETDAEKVMQLCRLQSRFLDGVEKIALGQGSVFPALGKPLSGEEANWWGALHYVELMDTTEDSKKKLYAVFAPTVPRVGEVVSPEHGSPMEVVGVEWVVAQMNDSTQRVLVPFVALDAIEEEDEEAIDDEED